jgi:diadenosine tetraphosphate (Ap4A) HIT family hydrolase
VTTCNHRARTARNAELPRGHRPEKSDCNIWRHGHIAEPADLGSAQAGGYWEEVLAVGRAVRERFDPVKLNYLTLGNTVPHLHTHVLPRYRDDPAPGGPIAWEEIFSSAPVPEGDLRRQAADLRLLLSR